MKWTKEQLNEFHRILMDGSTAWIQAMDYAASLVDGRVKELELEVHRLKKEIFRYGGPLGQPALRVKELEAEVARLKAENADLWNRNYRLTQQIFDSIYKPLWHKPVEQPAPVKPSKPRVRRFTVEEAVDWMREKRKDGFHLSVTGFLYCVTEEVAFTKVLAEDGLFYYPYQLDWE